MYSKKGIVLFVTLAMVFSGLFAMFPLTNASTIQQVGTVTLSPSTGAFPGQLVFFTWSNVPSDLVAPVYVTVWVNGTPYQTVEASYSGTTLTGSFVMPSENIGSSINLAFSYQDSAHGVSYSTTATTATGTFQTTAGQAYDSYGSPTSEALNYMVYGNTSATTNVTTTMSGSSAAVVNTAMSLNQTAGTKRGYLLNETSTGYSYNLLTNFSTAATLSGEGTYKGVVNLTVEAKSYSAGEVPIASPPSLQVLNVFHVNNTSKKFTVNYFTSEFYYNTSIEGTNVSILFVGNETSSFSNSSSSTTETLIGSFESIKPSTLDLTGAWSGTFDFTFGKYNFTYTMTATTTQASSPNNVVTFQITYTNSTATKVGFPSHSGNYSIPSTYKINLESSTFNSQAIGIENPVVYGVYNLTASGHGASVDFNFTVPSSTNSSVGKIGATTNFMIRIPITVKALNQTLVGSLQLNFSTSSFRDGVALLSNGSWKVSFSQNFSAMSSHITLIGKSVPSSQYLNISEGIDFTAGNYAVSLFQPPTTIALGTYLGYPELNKITIDQQTLVLSYKGHSATFTISPSTITLPTGILFNSNGATYTLYTNQTVSGFNTTLFSKYKSSTNLTFTVNYVVPAVYGYTAMNGTLNLTISYSAKWNSSNSDIILSGSSVTTPVSMTAYNNTSFMNSYNANTVVTSSGMTSYNASLAQVNVASPFKFTVGAVSYTSFLNYLGLIYLNATISGTISSSGTSISSPISSEHGITSYVLGKHSYANYTFNVAQVSYAYALYGVPAFTGYWEVKSDLSFATNISVKPIANESFTYFAQNFTLPSTTGPVTLYNSTSASGTGTLYDLFYERNINDFSLRGIIPPIVNNGFNFTVEMAFVTDSATLSPTLTGSSAISLKVYNYSVTPVSGNSNPKPSRSSTSVSITYELGAPAHNVTLIPIFNFSVSSLFINYTYYNNSIMMHGAGGGNHYNPYFDFNGSVSLTSKAETLTNSTGVSMGYSSTGLFEVSYLKFNALPLTAGLVIPISVNGVNSYVSLSQINIGSAGIYQATGTLAGNGLSGTASGYINVINYNLTNEAITVSGMLYVSGTFANGTAFNATVVIPATVDTESVIATSDMNLPLMLTESVAVGVMPHTGEVSFGSYNVVLGGEILSVEHGIAQILSGENNITVALGSLNAKISSVWSTDNNTYVTLNTDFGTMTAQLNALNATIMGISSGVATIQTDVGTIQTSLSELNAKLIAVNGTVATIQTDIGTVQTSLSSINATVTAINGDQATVMTSLGTISGTVTSINGTVATINTKLGTLQTSVGTVTTSLTTAKSGISSTLTFEVIVLILILLTLVIAIVAMMNINRASAKIDELKKQ